MTRMKVLFQEPLVHFLLIGIVFFIVFDLRQPDSGQQAGLIVINPGQIEQLAAQFERTWFRAPTPEELDGLIEKLVRNEVYYREARSMGLDQGDPVVRQRMRVKLEYLLEDLADETAVSDEQLEAFMQERRDQYRRSPEVSFTQVYFNPDQRPGVIDDAVAALARLDAGGDANAEGDRLLLEQNFEKVSKFDLQRSFGAEFADRLLTLEVGAWTGPIASGYGIHLVRISEKIDGQLPEFAEIRDELKRDYMAERRASLKEQAYQALRENYEVVVETGG